MGSLLDKFCPTGDQNRLDDAEETEEPVKQYSWDKKRQNNTQDFIVDGVHDQVVGKLPGSVNGEQFIVQNCTNCDIYVFDHSATVSVDDCTNCRMFFGPIKTSIFIRDCNNLVIVTACQQFRTRDCKKLEVFLCCVTQPIIEASTGVKFGCFQYNYPGLREQFKTAGISLFNNNWNNIHDFTPVPGESNHGLIPREKPLTDYLPLPTQEPYNTLEISVNSQSSVIPHTTGTKYSPTGDVALIAIFPCETQATAAQHLLMSLQSLCLVQTAEMHLTPAQVKRLFCSEKYSPLVNSGNVIMLQYVGSEIFSRCQDAAREIAAADSRVTIHVSIDSETGSREVEEFNNLMEMQMAV